MNYSFKLWIKQASKKIIKNYADNRIWPYESSMQIYCKCLANAEHVLGLTKLIWLYFYSFQVCLSLSFPQDLLGTEKLVSGSLDVDLGNVYERCKECNKMEQEYRNL